MTPNKNITVPCDVQDGIPPRQPETVSEKLSDAQIFGVFSTRTMIKIGTGTTQKKTMQTSYWFAHEGRPDKKGRRSIMVQPLNTSNLPSGHEKKISLKEFVDDYNPEPEFYHTKVYPQMCELNSTIKRAEKHRDNGALYSAQYEYEAALVLDEKNVRANFGLGLTFIQRGEPERAKDIFERIVSLDAAFAPEHKHLFNEFGISLRRSGLVDQAVQYYGRALDFTDDDENLYYNIARAQYERQDWADCRENLEKALELNPHMEEAQEVMEHINKKGL